MTQKILVLSMLTAALLSSNLSVGQPDDFKSIQIPGKNDISIQGDLYQLEESDKPFVLLFHQARYSRGEYRETAPWLNEMGFSCLAIDQRSGKKVNGVENKTFKLAKSKKLDTDYVSALPDLRAAIDYVLNELGQKELVLVGSSYSASLIFILATEYPEKVKGLAAFSPGEYFKYNNKKMAEFAANVNCPVFVTSAAREKKRWKPIYDAVKTEKIYYLPQSGGKHGSKALWSENKEYEKYRQAFKQFLTHF